MAIALAHERARQQSSFWAPYIATLPKKPGPAWTLSAPEVAVQLKALGVQLCSAYSCHTCPRSRRLGSPSLVFATQSCLPSDLCCVGRASCHECALADCSMHAGPAAHGWKRQIAALRETHTAASRRLSNAYGKQLGVGAADMMWALATVMSRCYVGEKVARLTPGLDLLNHGTQAWQLKGQRHLFTGRESMIARAEMQGSPCLLAAGDELLVDYGIGNDTKLMYLNYGFIDTKDIS